MSSVYSRKAANTFLVDSSKSSTYNLVSKGKFTDTFLGGAPIHGDFISDNFQVGGASITNLSLGLGIDKADTTQGLMGLGRNGSQVPSILSSMVDQGLINANAFSLYLDDIGKLYGSNSLDISYTHTIE